MNIQLIIYAIPLLLILAWHFIRRSRHERASLRSQSQARSAGLLEPASLHPLIDAARCIGCGACVRVCPEQPEHQVLGLISGKATLIGPTDCIGHGACRSVCPVEAITLVFGTETRGVELPVLNADFSTNVSGVYIAGELGGMGLIRNALTQGREAVEAMAKSRRARSGQLDLLIVGAGPAGLAAALTAQSLGLHYRVLEQESIGGCVFQYPRGKLVMTAPVELPLIGRLHLRETSKEQLLALWTQICASQQLAISCNERVEAITSDAEGLLVTSTRHQYRAASVLLAVGRRGTPRKLEVPGEELPKVVYRLIDPAQYIGQHVLVVGGGDSALEAAISISEQPDTRVTLSYRGETFTRAKPANRNRIAVLGERAVIDVLLGSSVRHIERDHVLLERSGELLRVPNSTVIVNAGGVLPNEFLRRVGIEVQTKYGTA